MPQQVQLPSGETAEFPDDASIEDITKAVNTHFGKAKKTTAQPKTSWTDALFRAGGDVSKELGGAAELPTSQESIIPEGALSAGPKQYDRAGKFIPSDAEKLIRPLATPANASILPIAGGESAAAKLVGGYFGFEGAKGTYDAAKVLADPNASQDEKHDAGLSLFANVPMAVAGAHGVIPKGVLPILGEAPPLPDVDAVARRNLSIRDKAAQVVTPAIQTPDGKVVTGDDHVAAYEKAKATGTPDTSGSKEGFVDDKGTFISREDAAAKTGLPTATEEGKLHSTDLPEDIKRYPSTDAARPDAVTLKAGDEAPVKFVSVQQGANHIGWYEPTKPFMSNDGGLYYPNENGTVKLSSSQIKNAGFKIPDSELEKFKTAGGAEKNATQPTSQIPTTKETPAPIEATPTAVVQPEATKAPQEAIDAAKQIAIKEKASRDINKGNLGGSGMGGAKPTEFENNPQTPTGIKNATVDAERAKRGLPPAIQPLRKSFGDVWDKAMAHIDQDPSWQDRLIDELRQTPRALTDEEDAALLQRQVDLQNQYGKATRELAQAFDDSKQFPNRADAVAEHRLEVARLSDQLLDLYNIGKRAGTETGRGLNARRMMAYEDYSLAQMELTKRAANDGRPLTDGERAEIQKLHDRIAETQKKYDDYVAATKDRIGKQEVDRLIAEERSKKPSPIPLKVLEVVNKIIAKWDAEADASREALKNIFGRTSAGVDPTIVLHVAKIGRSYLGHAALDFAEWSAKLVQELGENVKPYLEEGYKKAQDLIAKENLQNPLELARAMRNKPPLEQIEANSETIGKKIKDGKKGDIGAQVQRIARLLVQSGVTDREALIDRVHSIIQKHLPDIGRRETMDAISGYGDFKQLSKDQISMQLRGMKGEMQQLAKLEDITKGEPPLKSGLERRVPTEAERQLIKKVNEAKFAFQVPMTDPATQLKSALDTYKTNLRNRITDLQKRIADKDFAPRQKRELQLDAEAMRLKADAERVKQEFQQNVTRDRLKQRNWWQKTGDAIVKWRRGFILSGPVTLAKLTAAAVARSITTPLEEGVGAGIGKLIPRVAEKAPREGGVNLKAEAKAITEGIVQGSKDAWKTFRTGKSDLDAVYGKDRGIPQSFIDIFGNIHGALKAPVKRAEFARSFQKRAEFYAKQGVDITDPSVQTRIGLEAYQDANRAIFMQKNILNDAYKRALSRFDQLDKKTGRPSPAGAAIGTTARVLLPIVKVPTNIVAETVQYAIGTVTGSTRLAKAYAKGISELQPDEADMIMRHLKKGSLGAAALLLGFLNPKVVGGFYQQGEKRKKGDVPPMGIGKLPPSTVHAPLFEAAQIGATVRRTADSKLRKQDPHEQGLSAGMLAGALGLTEDVPFIRETMETSKAFNPHERGAFFGELGKSMLIPQAVQSIAQATDKDANGNPIKRKPRGAEEIIETGIPGLRKNVPKAPATP